MARRAHIRRGLTLAVASAALGCAAGCLTAAGGRLGTVEAEAELSAETRAELRAEIDAALDARLNAAIGTNPDQSQREASLEAHHSRVTVDQSGTDKWLTRGLAAGLAVNLALTIWLSYPVGRARRLRQQPGPLGKRQPATKKTKGFP